MELRVRRKVFDRVASELYDHGL